MKHLLLLLLTGFVSGGCAIMTQPMVARLRPDFQQEVDAAWSRVLIPPNHLTRQQLLDVVVAGELHHLGIDRLALRSEKQNSGGTVVLEVHFDRHRPEHDRFEVFVYDALWTLLRHERYSRAEIESTHKALFMTKIRREDQDERQQFVLEMLPWLRSDETSPVDDK